MDSYTFYIFYESKSKISFDGVFYTWNLLGNQRIEITLQHCIWGSKVEYQQNARVLKTQLLQSASSWNDEQKPRYSKSQ